MTKAKSRLPVGPVQRQAATPEEKICTTFCLDNTRDATACERICLSSSPANPSLYVRALRRAQEDGLQEPHRHIFAAGAVWAWLETTGLLRRLHR